MVLALHLEILHTHVPLSCSTHTHTYNTWDAKGARRKRERERRESEDYIGRRKGRGEHPPKLKISLLILSYFVGSYPILQAFNS
jgi:hypothetical protein